MRRASVIVACLAFVVGLAAPASADLDGFLASLNVQARADLRGFSLKLAAQFGVGDAEVQRVLRSVEAPADAFMCFQLGEMARKQPDVVLEAIKAGKGKGWGAIAQRLGIAPGSAEFKALKQGDLALTGQPKGKADKAKGKGPKK
jgi:hypothetical protein